MNDAELPAETPLALQGVVLAIDIGGTRTKFACYDPSTRTLRRACLDTHAAGVTGRAAVHRIISAARHWAKQKKNARLRSVAAVFPGVLRKGRLLMAANAPEFQDIDLRTEFAAAFGEATVILDNDVKAGALAEHAWGSLRGARQALYLNVGTGLAAAAIINGKVYKGHNGAALEIGYQLTPDVTAQDSSGWVGWRDGVAPMEAQFSGASLDALARQALGPSRRAKDAFESTHPSIQHELRRRLDAFASQLVNLLIAFDVERVAIGGGVSQQYPKFGAYLTQLIQRLVPFPPALLTARFADDAPLWGALELARQALHDPALPESLFAVASGARVASAHPAQPPRHGVDHFHDALAPEG